MATAGFRSGKLGRAQFNGVNLRITHWEVDPRADELDFANSEAGGFGEWLGGVKDCDWRVDFDYYVTNPSAPIFTAVNPGELVTNLILYIGDPADAVNWTFPVAFVGSGHCESTVRGKVSGSLRGRSTGTFTKPTS